MSKPFVVINIHSSWVLTLWFFRLILSFEGNTFFNHRPVCWLSDIHYTPLKLQSLNQFDTLIPKKKNVQISWNLKHNQKSPYEATCFLYITHAFLYTHRDLRTFYSFQAARRVAKLFLGPTRVFVAAVEMSKGNGGAPKRYTWVLAFDCKLRSLDWFRMDRCSKESNTFIKVETFCIQIGGELN